MKIADRPEVPIGKAKSHKIGMCLAPLNQHHQTDFEMSSAASSERLIAPTSSIDIDLDLGNFVDRHAFIEGTSIQRTSGWS